jgi:pimeloyl-ACP methyl ester carboxylesterase
VKRFTGVLLYDRAGLGRSDPGPEPRTSARMVAELRALLREAGIDPPYVLVGHSLGGLNARLFACRHPDEVAGLVLVDATPLPFPDWFSRRPAASAAMESMAAMASAGFRQEFDGISRSVREFEEAGPCPGIPVIVISSMRPEESPEFQATWIEMQRQMAGETGAVQHRIVERSGHYIQYDAPELVVEAIQQLVDLTRD